MFYVGQVIWSMHFVVQNAAFFVVNGFHMSRMFFFSFLFVCFKRFCEKLNDYIK